jgi:hypothetical protein
VTHSKRYLTPEQYLEIERKAEFKSEYYQSEMFAWSGWPLADLRCRRGGTVVEE